MNSRKVAILGGAFDPVTLGHINIAQYVLDNSEIEEVWLSPCSGHLKKNVIASGKDRIEMCYIATDYIPNIYISVYEVNKNLDGSAYSFITEIKKLWQDIDFHYIIGMDNVHSFDTWKKADELKSIVKFIVVPRFGVEPCKDLWYQEYPHRFLNVSNGIIDTSSTNVRNIIRKDKGHTDIINGKLRGLISDGVLKYILDKELYGD